MSKTEKKQAVVNADLDVLSYNDTEVLVEASIKANQPITIEGSPGIGKTAMIMDIGKRVRLPVEVLILSQCEPTDVGGYPVVGPDGSVKRLPLGSVKRACDEPVILFLDELTTAPPAVQAASLRLIHERVAGDVRLHPGTRIVAAQNPVEEAAGGFETALPLIGRLTRIKMIPLVEEIQAFFYTVGASNPDSHVRVLARDFAMTVASRPQLLQLKPPPGSATSGQPWAAPRAWERAVRLAGQILDDRNVPLDAMYVSDEVAAKLFYAALAGNLGPDAATGFVALRKLRDQLPSVKQILENPKKALVPESHQTELQVAALGLVAAVADKDVAASIVYAARLNDELRMAALTLLRGMPRDNKSPWFKDSEEALTKIIMRMAVAVHNSKK